MNEPIVVSAEQLEDRRQDLRVLVYGALAAGGYAAGAVIGDMIGVDGFCNMAEFLSMHTDSNFIEGVRQAYQMVRQMDESIINIGSTAGVVGLGGLITSILAAVPTNQIAQERLSRRYAVQEAQVEWYPVFPDSMHSSE